MPSAPPLPLRDPTEDQPPSAAPIEEPHIPASIVLTATSPLPTYSKPPMPQVPVDSVGPSTSTAPMETIHIYPCYFLAIMTSVHTFAATSASFATGHATLVERMT